LIARTIHRNGATAGQPFVAINYTAVPESLLESELFGHVRGSFTGAVGDRKGRFAMADSGTILLDEIGDTSLAFQAKLLRAAGTGVLPDRRREAAHDRSTCSGGDTSHRRADGR
jgi:transcriptional regulator with GAF, ATPase, and Fis domain